MCTSCLKLKPLDEFFNHPSGLYKRTPTCKPCTETKNDEWKKNNPERARETANQRSKRYYQTNIDQCRERGRSYHKERNAKFPELKRAARLKEKYGLTPGAWQALFDAQGKRCAICKTDTPDQVNAKWDTDHDHSTGKVRGILCSHCNRLLGAARDDASVLLAAITYLEDHSDDGA